MITETDKIFLRIAEQVAQLSDHPEFKVGAVIANGCGVQHKITSTGFNIQGKYHAEELAIGFLRRDSETIYVSHPPCHDCAMSMLNVGINRVVWLKQEDEFMLRWKNSNDEAKRLFDKYGVKWDMYDDR